ncbi:MAG: PAS domain S-box protein [Methanoregula sp.]
MAEKQEKILHILLIEDDRNHLDLILRAFKLDPEQFRISVAATIRQAREISGRDPPDLIISDWNLPDGTGIDILTRINGVVTTPLVVMTGFGDEHLAVEIMKSGAVDYIVKSATVFEDMPGIARKALRFWENIRQRKRAEEEKRDSDKRLLDIIGFLPDAVLAVDTEGRVIAWNKAIERLTGVFEADMLGKGDYEYSIPFYGERRPILIDLVLFEDPETEKKYDFIERSEGRITSEIFSPGLHGGRGAYLWATATSLYGSGGNRIGAIEVIRDITERKQAEEILKKREVTLEILLNAPNDTIVLLDRNGSVININEAGARRFGKSVQEVLGHCAYDLLPQYVARERKEIIDRVFATGEPARFDDERNGIYFHNEVYPVQNPDHENFDSVAIFSRDITDMKKAGLALQESEARFRDLFSNMSAGVAVYKPTPDGADFVIQDVNHAVETIENVRKDEITGKRILEIFPGVREFGLLEVLQRVAKTGTAESFPVSFYQDNRISGWRDNYVYRLPSGEVVALYEDVTEKKKAEERLRESEEKARTLMNAPTIGAFIIDREGILLDVNETILNGYRTTTEHILGKPVWDLFPPAVAQRRKEWVEEAIRTKEMVRHEDENEGRYHDIVIMPLLDSRGDVKRLSVVAFDITLQKQVQEALAVSEERYRALLNGAGIGVGYWSIDGTLLYLNQISLDHLKGREADLIGKNIHELFGERSELYVSRMRKAELSPDPLEYEDYVSLPEGNGWYLSIYSRISAPDGTPAGIQVLSMDITGRKQAEFALKQNEIQLREVMDLAQLVNWEFDALTGLFTFNDRFYTLYGTTAEREGGYMMPADVYAREFVYPEDQHLVAEEVRKAVETTDPQFESRVEHRIIRRDGGIRTIIVRFGIIKDAEGRTVKTFGANQDITERKQMEYSLMESEQKFRTVADYTYDWEYWILPDGKFEYITPSCERITGYSPEEFYKDPDLFKRIIHPDDLQIFIPHTEPGYTEADPEGGIEFRITAKNGNIVWIGHICHPLFNSLGEGIGRRGSNRDITTRRMAQDALRDSEIRFRAMIQNSSDLIRILDRSGRIIYDSPSSARILGYPPDFMTGKDPMDFIHPEDIERVRQDLRNVIDAKNTGTPTEFRLRKADGEYIWVDSIATNLLDVPGIEGIVITTRPIQQRKEAEQALRQSEERLRLSLEGADAGFWDWHLPTGQAVFSDRFYTMLGYEPGGFPPTFEGWISLMHPDDRDRVIPVLLRKIQERQSQIEIEYRIRSKEENWIWVLGRGKIVETDDKGEPIRMTGVNIDITNRRMMESEIRSLNAVLEQRVKDRTEALSLANTALAQENVQRLDAEAKIRSALEEKTILLKEVHHRVKNNLQIIVSLLNLQSRYIKDEPTLAAIRESQNRVKAMALVHEKLYRAEDIAHIDLNDYIKFLGTGLFQFYDAKSRGIRFSLDISGVGVDINTAIPLGLIINELISNSLKYAFPAGRTGEVFISVQNTGQEVTVIFRDDGIGIPADFDWRNTPSLGLRLVNSLVDQLSGTIELDRSAGTLFTIVLHEKE